MKLPAYSEIFTPLQWIVVAIFVFLAILTALPQSSDIFINIPYLGSISTETNVVYQMLILVVFVYFTDNAMTWPRELLMLMGTGFTVLKLMQHLLVLKTLQGFHLSCF